MTTTTTTAVAAAMTDAEAITTRVLDHLARAAADPGRPAEPALSGLPARAREVLGLVAQGLDDAAIAGWMGEAGCAPLPPVEVAGPLAVRLWPARRMAAAAMLPETTLQF